MINKLVQAFVAICVGTVLTQITLFGYFLTRGTVNGDSLTKVVALMNGIDISGNRLQQILRQSEDREQPDFDEILEARKKDSYDEDLKERSQKEFQDELTAMQTDLRDERARFDERLAAFRAELEEIRTGAQKEGLETVQRTLQTLDAAQAKEQLLIMYDDDRIDDVVTIVQAMPPDKRKDILAEFVSDGEPEKLADILQRISEGMPTTSLINQVNKDG